MKKFILATSLIAAGSMLANAEAFTWDASKDYSFTWDFSQENTQNGKTGVLGGTVSNTYTTEETDFGTAIKKGTSAGGYWETGTNSFFYNAITAATTTAATLTFSVDYYWTGQDWGENILHVGKDGTGIALGLADGYISFTTGTATKTEFQAAQTELRLTANAWNTITWTLSDNQWTATLGEKTSQAKTLGTVTWDTDVESERNKYCIGNKAPGYANGASGLNDSGCKLANLKVSYTAIPEPSAFGLLAGVGALALVPSRRRRK